jgi:hypothetical protein
MENGAGGIGAQPNPSTRRCSFQPSGRSLMRSSDRLVSSIGYQPSTMAVTISGARNRNRASRVRGGLAKLDSGLSGFSA